MTIEEALKMLYEEKMNRLHWLSADWRMEIPKKGCEKEHQELQNLLCCINALAEEHGVEL